MVKEKGSETRYERMRREREQGRTEQGHGVHAQRGEAGLGSGQLQPALEQRAVVAQVPGPAHSDRTQSVFIALFVSLVSKSYSPFLRSADLELDVWGQPRCHVRQHIGDA